MAARTSGIDVTRLIWAGPLAIVSAVAAVWAVRAIAFATMNLPADFVPLYWGALATFTAVLTAAGAVVFALVARWSADPLRSYRRIAFVALLLSLVPDLTLPSSMSGATWPAAIVLMIMHVAAWLTTVQILTRLTPAPAGVRPA